MSGSRIWRSFQEKTHKIEFEAPFLPTIAANSCSSCTWKGPISSSGRELGGEHWKSHWFGLRQVRLKKLLKIYEFGVTSNSFKLLFIRTEFSLFKYSSLQFNAAKFKFNKNKFFFAWRPAVLSRIFCRMKSPDGAFTAFCFCFLGTGLQISFFQGGEI